MSESTREKRAMSLVTDIFVADYKAELEDGAFHLQDYDHRGSIPDDCNAGRLAASFYGEQGIVTIRYDYPDRGPYTLSRLDLESAVSGINNEAAAAFRAWLA
jgi:hypothetical protein